MAARHRRRGNARARGRHRCAARHRRRARQLRPGPRIAPGCPFEYNRRAPRVIFPHDNAVENLILFAPLVLILAEIDYSTTWTVYACAVYFWARVAHLIVYTMGL